MPSLGTLEAMNDPVTTEAARITVITASDASSAQIKLRTSKSREPITQEEVLATLTDAGLDITDAVRAKAAEFVAAIKQDANQSKGFPIAKATPPASAVDGHLEWDPTHTHAIESWHEGSEANLYTTDALVIVEPDTVIGRIVDPQPARDGKDVRGNPIPLEPSQRSEPLSLTFDSTVRRSEEDESTVVATVRGRVVQTGQKLGIVEVLDIEGSVDHETGDVKTPHAVFVGDRIVDGRVLTAGGSVTVGSTVEAAHITSGGDVTVRRGILGRSKGQVKAEGSITARFASEANLVAGQDLKIGKQLMNSYVCLGGQLIAPTAALIGGNLFAGGCVEVHHIGSEANVKTRLVVGVVARSVHELAEVADRIKRTKALADRVRTLLKPLCEANNRINNEQSAVVTACLSLADKAESCIRDDEARREELQARVYTETVPSIHVLGTIHGGVRIQIGNRETIFRDDYEGPVLLECRKIRNVTEIVAVDPRTKTVKVLGNERTKVEDLVEGLERDPHD